MTSAPARNQDRQPADPRLTGPYRPLRLRYRAGLRLPDFRRVLRDGPVAGELARARDIEDRLARPCIAIRVQRAERPVRLQIGRQVRAVHVMVAVFQQRVVEQSEGTPLVLTEIVAGDQVERGPRLR